MKGYESGVTGTGPVTFGMGVALTAKTRVAIAASICPPRLRNLGKDIEYPNYVKGESARIYQGRGGRDCGPGHENESCCGAGSTINASGRTAADRGSARH